MHRLRERAGEDRGYTLIELLAVMLVIGVLASIAIPTFLNQQAKAYDASAKALAHAAQIAAESYATDNNGSYANLTAAALGALRRDDPGGGRERQRLRAERLQRRRPRLHDHGRAREGRRALQRDPQRRRRDPHLHPGDRPPGRLRQRHLVATRRASARAAHAVPARHDRGRSRQRASRTAAPVVNPVRLSAQTRVHFSARSADTRSNDVASGPSGAQVSRWSTV